jgi:hypothetical protein
VPVESFYLFRGPASAGVREGRPDRGRKRRDLGGYTRTGEYRVGPHLQEKLFPLRFVGAYANDIRPSLIDAALGPKLEHVIRLPRDPALACQLISNAHEESRRYPRPPPANVGCSLSLASDR